MPYGGVINVRIKLVYYYLWESAKTKFRTGLQWLLPPFLSETLFLFDVRLSKSIRNVPFDIQLSLLGEPQSPWPQPLRTWIPSTHCHQPHLRRFQLNLRSERLWAITSPRNSGSDRSSWDRPPSPSLGHRHSKQGSQSRKPSPLVFRIISPQLRPTTLINPSQSHYLDSYLFCLIFKTPLYPHFMYHANG